MPTVLLLIGSNIFMTFAWYGHLKYKSAPILIAILASWLIALAEYCLQVPANRLGDERFTVAQLKMMQEVITLVVFAVFSVLYLGRPVHWTYAAASVCLLAAIFFVFVLGPKKTDELSARHSMLSPPVLNDGPHLN